MKRINPHRKPVSQADLKKAKAEATEKAVALSQAIFLTVMRDKFGYGNTRLKRIWDEVNTLAQSIGDGYVSVDDLFKTLAEECNIKFS